MNCNHTALRALLVAAATLLATGAWAQSPNAAPQAKANAADKAEKAADKAGANSEKDKGADKTKGKDGKDAPDPSKAKSADERAARIAKEHNAQREKLAAMLNGPVTDALRQELRRHAERLARLVRRHRGCDCDHAA